jgi:hypothetical protein
MSFYSISQFRGAFNESVSKARLAEVERDNIRKEFAQYIAIKNIFSEQVISTVYVSYDSKFYVDFVGYAELVYAILVKFDLTIEPVYQSVDIDCIVVNAYESFDDVVNQVKEALNSQEAIAKKEAIHLLAQQKNKERKDLMKKLSTPLPLSLHDSKLLAIDFEYDQNKNQLVFECGITKSLNGQVVYEHYLVAENYKTKKNYELQLQFHFGESKVVSMAELVLILRQSLAESDYLVGHCLLSEYLVLEHYGLHIFDFEQLKCLDTQSVFQEKFNSGFTHSNLSLNNMLALFDIFPTHLHNAGNDAAYTMLVLMKMVNCIDNALKQNPERRKRIDLRKKAAKLQKQ